MTNINILKITKTAIIIFLGLSHINIYADECNRGSLSKQFCDRDGDLMADTPTNPRDWIDPYTLVIGTVPSQSFIFNKGAKKALGEHIKKVTGKNVEFFPYQTNSAELEAMRSGMLHIAGINTGSVPTAVNCAGFHLFAMTARDDGEYGYTMQIITYPGSKIKNINDIKYETILFTSSSSNSGHKAPVALLKERFGMQDGIDYKSRFSGSHSKSILKISNRQYKVAAVASGFVEIMTNQKKIKKDSINIIYNSEAFPTTGYGYNHRLKPSLAKKIEYAFKTFRWKDGNISKPINKFLEDHFIVPDYKNKWKIMRDIDKANNITYDCR